MGAGARREKQVRKRHHPLRLRRNENSQLKKAAASGEHPGFVRCLSGVAFGVCSGGRPSDNLARGAAQESINGGQQRRLLAPWQALDLLQATQYTTARFLAGEFLGLRM